jgi:hypothetical protein
MIFLEFMAGLKLFSLTTYFTGYSAGEACLSTPTPGQSHFKMGLS